MDRFDDTPRVVQVTAEQDVSCYKIGVAAFHGFGQKHAGIYAKILMNIIREIADTFRFFNHALRAIDA